MWYFFNWNHQFILNVPYSQLIVASININNHTVIKMNHLVLLFIFILKLSLLRGFNLFHSKSLNVCDNFNNNYDRVFCENFMLASQNRNLNIENASHSQPARRVTIEHIIFLIFLINVFFLNFSYVLVFT